LKITFLGTGTSQGIPVIGSNHPVCQSSDPRDKRLRVSVLVSWKNYNFVIDCGPDFRQQMLANKVVRLDGILFTHEHADHTAGIDDIRPYFFRQGDIPIYAHQRVVDSLRRRFDYIFADDNRYPGAPAVKVNLVRNNEPFPVGDIKAVPILGYRLGDFAYLTDVKTISDEESEKLKGVKVLTVNALRKDPHHSHFNLDEALDFVEKVGPGEAYFTHISHHMGFHEEVEKELPPHVHLAYDNLSISL